MVRDFKSLLRECAFEFVRSRGPGGQHVNRTESAVLLRWSLDLSTFFSENEKAFLKTKLQNILNKSGEIVLRTEESRSQEMNKKIALEKFLNLIKKSLLRPKKRIATKPTKGSVERKKTSKQKRSQIKSLRGKSNIEM